MIDPKSLLQYWRASLADGQLPDFPRWGSSEVDWDAIHDGSIFAKPVFDDLKKKWKRKQESSNKWKDKEIPSLIPVWIAPLVFRPRAIHGTTGKAEGSSYVPLIIPALLGADGSLSGNGIPWFSRAALEPSASPEPPLGELADFDEFRSRTQLPRESTWTALMDYTEALSHKVTRRSLDEITVEKYERSSALIIIADKPFTPTMHLIKFADALLDDTSDIPETFLSMCRGGAMRSPLQEADRRKLSARHYGQMGAEFPLADRQRDAIHHLLSCEAGEILPVNGPPGTGKTTLLQSVVATLMVEAALAGGDPPIIFVTSTNNQAVTNVIDSFAKAAPPGHRRNDPMEGRWVPKVESLALYLPSGEKEYPYQIAYLPAYREPLKGFPADMLRAETVATAKNTFLAAASTAFGKSFGTIAEVQQEIETHLVDLSSALKSYSDSAGNLMDRQAARPKLSLETFTTQVEARVQEAKGQIASCEQRIAVARTKADAAHHAWIAMDQAAGQGLEQLYPGGGVARSLLAWLLGFLPPIRTGRWERCRRVLRQAGIESGPCASLVVPHDFDEVRQHLDSVLAPLHHQAQELRQELEKIMLKNGEVIKSLRAEMDSLETEVRAWQAAQDHWVALAKTLYTEAEGTSQVKETTLHDLVNNPNLCEQLLDITVRHALFLLATHYWEARWLQQAIGLIENPDSLEKILFRNSYEITERRWNLMACLTPCFVSTLYMLPKYLDFFDPKRGKGVPLTNFVDLLIVDEAGQVPPEVGGLGLALGCKALVVGDVHQIEPVWSIGENVDQANLDLYGLDEDMLNKAGMRSANGSLMKVAHHASAFTGREGDEPGIFLNEHRRCQTPIISICNDLVYSGRLQPKTPTVTSILPPLGRANVRAQPVPQGTSWVNRGEAEAIAEWLARWQEKLEKHYAGRPLHELVGIITPFRAQKTVLQAALHRHGIETELTVGTVHALQGAEREIVLFSPVQTRDMEGEPFFNRGINMVNVAVSRARASFLVFGDMRLFDPERMNGGIMIPSAILGKSLFDKEEYEITDALCRPEFLMEAEDNTILLDGLESHRSTLREAFERATTRILVASPFLSDRAITTDDINDLVLAARRRNVDVTVAYNFNFNINESELLKASCTEAITKLAKAGARILECSRIHNKTLAVDDHWLVEGSFNWFSAVRDPDHEYANHERSMRYSGPRAKEFIKSAWKEMEEREIKSGTLWPPVP